MSTRAPTEGRAALDLPLADYERFHSSDIDETRAEIATAFCAHRLTPGSTHLDARFHGVTTGSLSLHYLEYGAPVRIQTADLADCYLVQIPLAGVAEITRGTQQIVSTPALASVLEPGDEYDMVWQAGNRQLIVKIDRTALEEHLHRTLGVPVGRPLRFELGMDLTAPATRSWRGVVELLRGEFEAGGVIPSEPLAMRELQRLLLSQLLIAQPNSYTATLSAPAEPVITRTIRRAAELIEAHAAEPLTVQDVAEAVHVSVRALQDGFRKSFETTPMQYLREVRLQRVHADLSAADPSLTSVTDVAVRWGFLHLGRFAVLYRERFGESPSQTLRR